jgi:ubiquitin-protein ligase E3 C
VKTIDLLPNGCDIMVTRENRIQYIYLTAHYKLNLKIHRQCAAFIAGLKEIVDLSWLEMFNHQELQILIGGASMQIDVKDMKLNTVYDSLFSPEHPTILYFWEVVEHELNNADRQKLVKFITSCPRPPLLGFKELRPSMCIRMAGDDQSRLPTASTCVNLLKLPAYKTKELLEEKLLYAINAGGGFGLS